MDDEKLTLNNFILEHFNLSEVRDLCFHLGVDSNDLEGNTRQDKARELIEHLRRRGRLTELHLLLKQQRPEPYNLAFPTVSIPATFPARRIHEKTGIELIRIPAGPFLYGSAESDKLAPEDEKPLRTIDLPEYWIGRAPVINAQFVQFALEMDYRTTAELKGEGFAWNGYQLKSVKDVDWRHPYGPMSSIDGKNKHPVVQVSWDDAKAFCDWAGLVLPTEEQWEKAARGMDGRIWPWGNDSPTDRHCNFLGNVGRTTPVGKYSPRGDSPYGCVDMAGNVWEWTESWYEQEHTRTLRGGGWNAGTKRTRAAYREGTVPHNWVSVIGFRVAELLSDPAF